jgi:hypothetical protein
MEITLYWIARWICSLQSRLVGLVYSSSNLQAEKQLPDDVSNDALLFTYTRK